MLRNYSKLGALLFLSSVALLTAQTERACNWLLEGWQLQGSLLVLQPGSSNLAYAAEAYPLPTASPHWQIFQLKPDYHCGFDLGLKKKMRSGQNDIRINWERFRSCDGAAMTVATDTNMVGPFFEIGPDALPYKNAAAAVGYRLDVVSLAYAQSMLIGTRLQVDCFGGLSFANVGQALTTSYANNDNAIVRVIRSPACFIGAGPYLGADMRYALGKGFSCVGKAEVAMLVGQTRNHTAYLADSPALADLNVTAPNKQYTYVQKSQQVVPGFTQKIAVAYACAPCDSFDIALEAGYQAQIYLNALQSVNIRSEVITPPVTPDTVGVYARTFGKELSNFFLAGPYVTLSAQF